MTDVLRHRTSPHCFHSPFLATLLNHHENPKLEHPPTPQTSRSAAPRLHPKPVGATSRVYHLECSKNHQFSAVLLDPAEMFRSYLRATVPFPSSTFGICCANSWFRPGTVYGKEENAVVCLGWLWPGVFISVERRK